MGCRISSRNKTISMEYKTILSIQEAAAVSKKLRESNKRVVLTGGCFDILHIGHSMLLERAKAAGDMLFVLLEPDKKIAEIKGPQRPFQTQKERAYMLSSLRFVDYVVLLPYFSSNEDYDKAVTAIHPDILAVTKGDKGLKDKKRQARNIGAIVSEVIEYIPNRSTSAALKTLLKEK